MLTRLSFKPLNYLWPHDLYKTRYSQSHLDLPPEIWYRIAALIPLLEFERSGLYAVNRPFLLFYMERKHIRLCLSYKYHHGRPLSVRDISGAARYIKGSPLAPSIIRHLEIKLSQDDELKFYEPHRRHNNTSKLAKFARKGLRRAVEEYKELRCRSLCYDIDTALLSLNGLTSSGLKWVSMDDLDEPPSGMALVLVKSLSSAWSLSISTLTTLSFTFNGTPHFELELPWSVKFPNLRELRLGFRETSQYFHVEGTPNSSESVIPKEFQDITPFLISHRSLIQRLTLMFPSSKLVANLLDDMPFFESLVDLSLAFSIQRFSIVQSAMIKFTNKHSKNIRSYAFKMFTTSGPYFDVDSGSVGELSLSLPSIDYLSCSMIPPQQLCSFISNLGSRIKTLAIGMELGISEIKNLFVNLSNGGGQSHLENLYLYTKKVDAELFSWLASTFPSLKALWIRYPCYYGYNSFEIHDLFEMAAEGLSQVVLDQWNLEEFYLERYLERWFWVENNDLYKRPEHYSRVVPQALPHVKYFNGLPRGGDNWLDNDTDILKTPWFFEVEVMAYKYIRR
ncbi:hypothetical protein NP233_g9327 [Leucocoprinus birnbaumii]|uniref:Uncharacterized protein n=1 Tax=Leucocoprinus birnbaumii TaxID=56174 RepID=A0AAD5YQY8_9AGAR|nr:hypothetical protein NP233_g9327 [Leucocoprinus birnbaumii]